MSGPFRRVVNVRTLPRKGREERHVADDAERRAIADHLDVVSVESAAFEAKVVPWKRDGVRIEGRLAADLTQACVVSLEPVAASIDEPFEAILVPEGSKLAAPRQTDAEMLLDAEGEDPPETFEGDTIDLADVWLEFLALAIDPFPRKPDAELPGEAEEGNPSPFAALAALKPANDR